MTKKLGQISKIGPEQIQTMCPSLRIRSQLPAPIVNGGGDSFWKWPDFQLWRAHDLDLESGHTAYQRVSLIDLYRHAKFHWNQLNFLWTDLLTSMGVNHGGTSPLEFGVLYVCTDGWTFETGFIKLTLSKSRPNNAIMSKGCYSFFHVFMQKVNTMQYLQTKIQRPKATSPASTCSRFLYITYMLDAITMTAAAASLITSKIAISMIHFLNFTMQVSCMKNKQTKSNQIIQFKCHTHNHVNMLT